MYFHELTKPEQNHHLNQVEIIIASIDPEATNSTEQLDKKLTAYWMQTSLNVPEMFNSHETYADFYDEDYFGLLKESLQEHLIELSEDHESEFDNSDPDYDCPGSENERNFYRS